jgi:hypothetical protein
MRASTRVSAAGFTLAQIVPEWVLAREPIVEWELATPAADLAFEAHSGQSGQAFTDLSRAHQASSGFDVSSQVGKALLSQASPIAYNHGPIRAQPFPVYLLRGDQIKWKVMLQQGVAVGGGPWTIQHGDVSKQVRVHHVVARALDTGEQFR